MKKIIILLIAISCSTFCKAQNQDSLAIVGLMNEQLNAWNKGDIDAFMQTYWQSDSLMFVSNPPTYGWQSTLKRYKKSYKDTVAMGKLSFDLLQLKQLSTDYYFVIGKWHLQRTIGDVGGVFDLLFKKINGEWLIIVDHSS